MIEVSKTVAQFIGDFKALDYCCHRIIELNQELEVLNHKKLGLSHDHEELSKEQSRQGKIRLKPPQHGGGGGSAGEALSGRSI